MTILMGVARVCIPTEEPLFPHLPAESRADFAAPLARTDRLSGLALVATERLLTGRPNLREKLSGDEVAVVLGTADGSHKTDAAFYCSHLDGQPSPRLFAPTLPSAPSGELSIRYRLRGPGFTLCGDRTCGLAAIAEAQRLLWAGLAQACLVVAVETAGPFSPAPETVDAAVACFLVPHTPSAETAAPASAVSLEAMHEFYAPQSPNAAVAHILSVAAPSVVSCDERTARLTESALAKYSVHRSDAPDGAVAGLWQLCDLLDPRAATLVCADSGGNAAAVSMRRLERQMSKPTSADPGPREKL